MIYLSVKRWVTRFRNFGWNFFAEIYESSEISLNGLFGHLDSLFYRLAIEHFRYDNSRYGQSVI